MWFFLVYIFGNQILKTYLQRFFENVIDIDAWAFNIVLKIHYKSFFVYPVIGTANEASKARDILKTKIELIDNSWGLKISFRLLNRKKLNLEEIKLSKFSAKLQS